MNIWPNGAWALMRNLTDSKRVDDNGNGDESEAYESMQTNVERNCILLHVGHASNSWIAPNGALMEA